MQREAVAAPVGNLLIVAGAGSGKTRVLVHRLAWLVEHEGVSPFEIVAVTFTNKAANEMKARTESLLQMPLRGMWMGTFHSIAHRLLRVHWREANLTERFEIIDQRDQEKLVGRLLEQLNIRDKDVTAREAANYINKCKDHGLRVKHMSEPRDMLEEAKQSVYKRYEDHCQNTGLTDFGELLLRSHELWLENADILNHYRARFRHILVDEFQDTNAIQYAWLRVLAGNSGHVVAVGDDDQSIYGWRGAEIENIRSFETELANTKIIRLEQNYRSTPVILSAANELIEQNVGRLGKTLWTEEKGGDLIRVFNAYNEFEEADYIAEKSLSLIESGSYSPNDIAVLYRNNSQSRILEEKFQNNAVPYRVYGGPRFYGRAEIRNALAYMGLTIDRHKDSAFERVVNVPPRRIGAATMDRVRQISTENQVSLWDATVTALIDKKFDSRATTAMQVFVNLIEDIARDTHDLPLDKVAEFCVHASGLMNYHSSEKGEAGLTRRENLEELIIACEQYQRQISGSLDMRNAPTEIDRSDVIQQFLDNATLDAGDYQAEASAAVSLMTLHSAKGLEFPLVFIAGMEESLFPNDAFAFTPDRLEEERRLAYVGITRAMKQLYLTHASSRTVWRSRDMMRTPSRFLLELPRQYLTQVRVTRSSRRELQHRSHASFRPEPKKSERLVGTKSVDVESQWSTGQKLQHARFGKGKVIGIRGNDSAQQIQIEFLGAGRRWIKADSTTLTRI